MALRAASMEQEDVSAGETRRIRRRHRHRGARGGAGAQVTAPGAARMTRAEPTPWPTALGEPREAMGRHFIMHVKGHLDMHSTIYTRDAGAMDIEGTLGIEGPVMPRGVLHSGMMYLSMAEDPTMPAFSSVACSGGAACLDPRMIICG